MFKYVTKHYTKSNDDVGQYTREVAVDELAEQSPKSGWTHDSDFNKCAKKKLKQPVHTTVGTSRILNVAF